MASTYTWTAGSGEWSDGANWMDVSDPGAGTAPGTLDTTTIDGPVAGFDLITGPGNAALLTTAGNVVFDGTFAFGSLTNQINQADMMLVSAGSVVSATTSTLSGLVQIDGPGASLHAGIVTLSGPDIVIEDHASFRASSLSNNDLAGQLILDATSTAEIGGGSIATAGTLAIDTGAILHSSGTIDAPILDQGTIETTATLTLTGAVGGDGEIVLNGTYDLLVLDGAVASGNTIEFADRVGLLVLPELSAGTMDATIAGFAPGDEIDLRAAGVDGVTYAATGNSLGTLTFTANGATVETLTISGNYTGQTFLLLPSLQSDVDPLAATAALVLAPNTPTTPVAAVTGSGTGTFSWQLVNGGSWDDPSNWSANGRVPGAGNPVMIFGTPGAVAIVNGNGNSASLTIDGSVALNGMFATGVVTDTAMLYGSPGTLDLLAGTRLTAISASLEDVLVDGAGASLSVTGTLTIGTDGATIRGLVVANDAQVTAASLLLHSASITVDATSKVEVGTGGLAQAGTIVIDPGALLTVVDGTIESTVLNDGTLLAGGTFPYGTPIVIAASVYGSGTLQIADSKDLVLQGNVAATETIEFAGQSAMLDVTNAGNFGGVVSGLAASDALMVGANVASVSFTPTGHNAGTLMLLDASGATVRSLTVSGDLSGNSFVLQSLPGYASPATPTGDLPTTAEIVLAPGTLQVGPPPPAAPGTATGQTFTWIASGGDWGSATNWQPGTVPGRLDTVAFGGPVPVGIVSGSGNAASVSAVALALSGVFSFGTLQSDAVTLLPETTLVVGSFTAGPVTVSGEGSSLDVTGTASLGGQLGSPLLVKNGGLVQLASVQLYGSGGSPGSVSFQVDSKSALEIGTDGAAALGAITIDAGQVVSGFVYLDLSAAVHDEGTIVFGFGGLIEGAVDGAGTLEVGGGSTLSIDGSVASDQTIDLVGEKTTLILSQQTDATIIGFDQSDTIEVLGLLTRATYTALGNGVGQLDLGTSAGTTQTLTLAGDFTASQFLPVAQPAETFLQPVTMTKIVIAACFAEGTRIATEHGAVPIEHLTVGTLVHTPWNQMLPIEWIGRRRTDCRRHPRPHDVWPVRVSAHAFGPDRPVRDLFLSPDHAVHIDGLDGPDLLIPVRYLINGATIRQIAVDDVTYWHIELPRHDVVLAEGLSCESYLDTGNRCAFENGGPAVALHPDFARAVWNEQACAELTLAGPALTAVRAMLLANAQSLGHLATDDAGLTVHADGQMLEPTGPLTFDLPAGTKTVTLASRTAVPAHVHADAQDFRKLGVAVADLMLDGKPVPPDDPRFGTGWFPAEPEWRWTGGHAALATGGATRLSLRLKPYLTYWVADDVRPESAPASPPTRARPEKPLPKPRRAGRNGRAARL